MFDATTALLVVDVQNDFADPGGGLYVRDGEQVVPLVSELVGAAQNAGSAVVYTQDWHPASTPHFAKDGGIWPVHCVVDTWGAELHPQLLVQGPVVRKGTSGEDGYSGFSVRDPVTGGDRADPAAVAARPVGAATRRRRAGRRLLRQGDRAGRRPARLRRSRCRWR